MSDVKRFAQYISEQQRIAEAMSVSDPIAYHKKMIDHHNKMEGHHDNEREVANDNDNSDLAHDHANESGYHYRAGLLHRDALEAHENKKPDAMEKTKKAFERSDEGGMYFHKNPPKTHTSFGNAHNIN